ncbi:hypothetical protein PSTT_07647 [Puccinia striiformis]|uniref:Uncharacterized protein n=1 Tax=Puccinia striiformis TaxID=27350 RepID=A0A2S4VFF5_9BASI|nr:hypothetical protein PSTT_07647 [Puccinia striiformis]
MSALEMIKLLAIKVGHFQLAKNDGFGAKRIPSWGFRHKSTYFLESTSSDRDQSVHLRVMSIHRAGGKFHITEHHSYLGRLRVIAGLGMDARSLGNRMLGHPLPL